MGKGLGIDTAISLSSESIVGKLNVTNPNYNNTDKSISVGLQALETDKLTNFGYKSKKIGGSVGTQTDALIFGGLLGTNSNIHQQHYKWILVYDCCVGI